MSTMWIVSAKIVLCTLFMCSRVSGSLNDQAKVINYLFKNYSNQVRPVKNDSEPIVVQIGFELIQIIAINERDQHITNKIWMRIGWTNELLKWNPEDWGGISSLNISPDKLWVPDIVLYNEVDEHLSEGTGKYKTQITIDSDGKHRWLTPLLTTSSCAIDVTDFPFDYQICRMKYGSWSFDKSKLDIIEDNRPIVTSYYVSSTEWSLLNATKKVNSLQYTCCINPFMDITFTFTLKRRALYYVFNFIVPCLILIIIILFSFFLPCDCVERNSLIVTMLLAFIVFLELVSGYLPRNSDTMPCLSIYYLTVMVESACTLAATCIVVLVHRKGAPDGARPPPEWIRRYMLQVPEKRQHAKGKCHIEKNNSTYDVNVRSMKPNATSNNCLHTDAQLNSLKFLSINSSPSEDYSASKAISKVTENVTRGENGNKEEKIEKEWYLAAKYLDRVFFSVFLLIYLISFLVIILPSHLRKQPIVLP